jgi:hypothetical protein
MTTVIEAIAGAVISFSRDEVENRLRPALQKVADDSGLLRPAWEPLLDSQRVIRTVLVIEDLFPTCKISPDRVVRKGGYFSVDEAIDDMLRRIEGVVVKHYQKKGRT